MTSPDRYIVETLKPDYCSDCNALHIRMSGERGKLLAVLTLDEDSTKSLIATLTNGLSMMAADSIGPTEGSA